MKYRVNSYMLIKLIIPQVERFASKYAFAKLTIEVFHTVLAALNEKANNPTGNKYVFI